MNLGWIQGMLAAPSTVARGGGLISALELASESKNSTCEHCQVQ